ncbi:hypothetical protein An08g04980 [Aspergillus niger]|uniref:Uncharacterized protein n=2 Tax=Aspergillus niger TaxID=5061 RepID=A2QR70_ASPNC|nr:hypothetical protein An08g04980 [Aspergillus niger]CAK45471.1 hypothetical protein An08g04980 [Aspergillus niger]
MGRTKGEIGRMSIRMPSTEYATADRRQERDSQRSGERTLRDKRGSSSSGGSSSSSGGSSSDDEGRKGWWWTARLDDPSSQRQIAGKWMMRSVSAAVSPPHWQRERKSGQASPSSGLRAMEREDLPWVQDQAAKDVRQRVQGRWDASSKQQAGRQGEMKEKGRRQSQSQHSASRRTVQAVDPGQSTMA